MGLGEIFARLGARIAPKATTPIVRTGAAVGVAGGGLLLGSGVGQAASTGGISGAIFGNDQGTQQTNDLLVLALVGLVLVAVVLK